MAPSRGPHPPTTNLNTTTPASTTPPNDDTAIAQQSNSALANARRNFNYFLHPTSPNSPRPARLRTRALLRTLRYVTQFIFWRLVRWAKYIAVGSLVAAIGATAFGSVVSGVAWIAAPPTIGASVLAAGVWGTGKFAARRLHARWARSGGDEAVVRRESVEDAQESGVRVDGGYGFDVGPRAVPW